MHFSEIYSVGLTAEDDWFDTYLPSDSAFCIDPFLLYEADLPEWVGAHDRILDFFAMVFALVRQAKGNKKSPAWRQAQHLLLFPEPAEFCLGVAEGSPLGAGSGPGLQKEMLEGIQAAVRFGITSMQHMEMLALFQGGMGLDRISDVVCNILKSNFISYTQKVCTRHGIPMQSFLVKHANWSEAYVRWQDKRADLPVNPYLSDPHPVLLTPEQFLKDIPVVTANKFWTYAWSNHASEIRDSFNYDVAYKVPRHIKARLARSHISVVEDYLRHLEETKHKPYPIGSDPRMLVNWYEAGAGVADKNPLTSLPERPDQFKAFVNQLMMVFKRSIEDQGTWELLWAHGRGLRERVVQKLFQSIVVHYCRANEVTMSPESNAGRGPVDFKFGKSWTATAIVEIKLMRNSKFWDGVLAQVPQYARSEEVKTGFFVAIAYADEDMRQTRISKIEKAASMASEHNDIEIVPVIVDARPKESASNIRADQSERDELHMVDSIDDEMIEEDGLDSDDDSLE